MDTEVKGHIRYSSPLHVTGCIAKTSNNKFKLHITQVAYTDSLTHWTSVPGDQSESNLEQDLRQIYAGAVDEIRTVGLDSSADLRKLNDILPKLAAANEQLVGIRFLQAHDKEIGYDPEQKSFDLSTLPPQEVEVDKGAPVGALAARYANFFADGNSKQEDKANNSAPAGAAATRYGNIFAGGNSKVKTGTGPVERMFAYLLSSLITSLSGPDEKLWPGVIWKHEGDQTVGTYQSSSSQEDAPIDVLRPFAYTKVNNNHFNQIQTGKVGSLGGIVLRGLLVGNANVMGDLRYGALVIVQEPENSSSISWQRRYNLKDGKVASTSTTATVQANQMDFAAATAGSFGISGTVTYRYAYHLTTGGATGATESGTPNSREGGTPNSGASGAPNSSDAGTTPPTSDTSGHAGPVGCGALGIEFLAVLAVLALRRRRRGQVAIGRE